MTYSLVMSDDSGTAVQPVQRPGLVRRTLTSSLYLFVAWPMHLAVFIINITLLSTVVTFFLAPLAVPLLIGLAAGAAAAERRMVSSYVGLDAPPMRRLGRGQQERWTDYVVRVLKSPAVWLEVVWSLLAWTVSTVTWVIALAWWTITVSAMTWPAYGWIYHGRNGNQDVGDLLGAHSYVGASLLTVGLGSVFLVTLPLVIIGMAKGQGLVSAALLCRAQQEAKIAELTESRDAARVAESAQLSRLERDIHDGPQQRLVRLKMDLARMERQVGDDSHAILGLRAAIASTQETLDELRALSKGIAPPVLSDRGLVAAVREAAGRATIPITVEADLHEVILPPHLEQAAYFVVSEALTNTAKHSAARSALVSLQVNGIDLSVSVTDDGQGGAHLSKGSGLVGLQSRVRSVGGTLTIDSPMGGPTTVLAVIPLT